MRNPTPLLLLSALAALAVTACGGGSGSPAALPLAAAPTQSPVSAPSATVAPPVAQSTPSPVPTPTTAPTASPVPLALRVIGGAPLSASASQLSRIRTQAKTTAQGIANGLPVLVESSGSAALWAGDFVTWTSNAQTAQDISQTSGQITTTGGLLVNNPGFSQACLGSLAAACIVHPSGWQFGTDSGQTKPVGKQTLTITFGDGTTGTTNDYVYPSWTLPCNAGWVFQAGAIVPVATRAAADVYADCVAGNIVFPLGAFILSQPSQDQYGRTETALPALTAKPIFIAAISNVSMASILGGTVFAMQTQDGGFAKVYFTNQPSIATNAASGMSLHSNPTGAFDF